MRLRIITPLLNYRRGSIWAGMHPDGVKFAIRTKEELAWYLSWRWGISRRTIWGWYGRFEKGAAACRCSPRNNDCASCGRAALRDETRADKSESRYFEANPSAAELVRRGLAVGRSPKAIYQALQMDLGLLKPPSYETVRCYVRTLRSVVQ